MIDLLKLAAVFLFIVLLLRRRVNLGLAMLLGTSVLGIVFGLALESFGSALVAAATAPSTIELVIALLLIMVLENVMRRTGMLRMMVDSLGGVVGDRRIVMALLPAFLGLLPSAGGARFSAPLVEAASEGLPLTAERKGFINYWYRHIWEFTFPLYPSLILATQLLGLSMAGLVALLFPFTLVAIVVGAPFAFRGISGRKETADEDELGNKANRRHLVWGLSPVVIVALLVIGLGVNIALALGAVVAGLLFVHRYTRGQVMTLAREALSLEIVGMVLSVMIFKEVLLRSGAIESLPAGLAALGVPGAMVVFFLPFVVGLATGYAQAPVAVGFPLIMGLLTPGHFGLITLAFVGGFAGVMLSPAHLCLVLTAVHFRTSVSNVLKLVLVPELLILTVAVAVAYLR